jgi:FAD/FMN-containing dehydrogenase
VLVEALGGDEAADAERFERVLGKALEDGLIVDAVIAKSGAERAKMWALRDDVGHVNRKGPAFTFDVSLRIADMPAYIAEVDGKLRRRWPDADNYVFGHLGDGNLHLLIWTGERSPETKQAVEDIVYGPLQAIGGSVSAEHGIGLHKKAYLPLSRNPGEIALMKALKASLDPQGILNPGKIFS